MNSELITCIYCMEKKLPSEFNREHVLPEAFGSFKNNLVLLDIVCKDCNQCFGDNLDIILARGSMQGAIRYFKGIKPLRKFEDVNKKRVQLAARTKYDKDFREAEIVETPDGDGLAFTPGITYISVSTKKETFVSLKKLESGSWKDTDDLNREELAILSYRDDDTLHRIQQELKQLKLGVEILESIGGAEKGERVIVVVDAVMEDELMNRAVTKIAFNYLAYIMGRTFMERPIFNRVRDFICHGSSSTNIIKRIRPTKLYGDTAEAARRKGHVITVDLSKDLATIIGNVEFFSTIAYKIQLGMFEKVTIPISAGHYYDIVSNEAMKMDAIRPPLDLWFPR